MSYLNSLKSFGAIVGVALALGAPLAVSSAASAEPIRMERHESFRHDARTVPFHVSYHSGMSWREMQWRNMHRHHGYEHRWDAHGRFER